MPVSPLRKTLLSTTVSVTLSKVSAVPAKLAKVRLLIVLPEALLERTRPSFTVVVPKIDASLVPPRIITGRFAVIVLPN